MKQINYICHIKQKNTSHDVKRYKERRGDLSKNGTAVNQLGR